MREYMKLKYSLAFLMGILATVSYDFIAGGFIDQNDPERQRGITTDVVRERFEDICSVLEGDGCSCRPTVLTEARCGETLTKALYNADGVSIK